MGCDGFSSGSFDGEGRGGGMRVLGICYPFKVIVGEKQKPWSVFWNTNLHFSGVVKWPDEMIAN